MEQYLSKIWFAGSPETNVGDIIIQEDLSGLKYKFPVQLSNELGVKQQLVKFVIKDKLQEIDLKDTIEVIQLKTVSIYKKINQKTLDYIFVIHGQINMDKIPNWIILK
jgi:hypothetical protein